jgi:GGDEF domain-containing protein
MSRDELVEFFQREAGRAYDPDVVAVFLDNMDEMERAGAEVEPIDRDIWGIEQLKSNPTAGGRRFEHVEPAKAYGEAMNADSHIQRVLYSIFAFARSSRLLNRLDIIEFFALKLEHLIKFDAAVLYLVEGNRSVVVGRHRFGSMAETIPADIEIPLEQKLSGWVAANNQALCNLPPFPDFLRLLEPKPDFELSAIAPVNFRGSVIGSLALYRAGKDRFSDESFRLLEIVASQLAMALSCARHDECETPLFDEDTMLPTSHQIYLMYEQVAVDAQRYDFPLSLIVFHVENLDSVPLSRDGRRNTILRQIVAELQIDAGEGDVFVRHSSDVFVGLYARTDCRQASRLQDRAESRFTELRVQIDPSDDWRLRVAIGAAQFPADGASVEDLFRIAEERAAAKMLDTLEVSLEPSLFHRL